MKKLFVLSVVLLGSIGMFAQHRSEQEAIELAQNFLNSRSVAHKPDLKAVSQQHLSASRRMSKSAQKATSFPGYYIVNDEANQRFVVVGADERMHKILGYSDNGTFSADRMPEQFLEVLGWYDAQMEALQKSALTVAAPEQPDENVQPIAPLIKTAWGQEKPYNNDCPSDSHGLKCTTGCVATAMAQVMNYHRHPEKAQGGTVSYTTQTTGIEQSLNFNTITFDWSKMQNRYTLFSPQASKSEVAKLMHACGVSVFMDYSIDSGTIPALIPYAMIHYFAYNPNMQYVLKDYYDSKEWNDMIRKELSAGRPVLYGGSGTTQTDILGEVEESHGSHRFILDGMDKNGLYHFNFGWTGECDGYFAIDAIHPVRQFKALGIPLSTSTYDFNLTQGLVMGISPEELGEEADVFYTMTLKLDTCVKVDSLTSITFQPYCCSNKTNKELSFEGKFGLGVFDKDWNLIDTLYTANKEISVLHAGGYYRKSLSGTFCYDAATFREGQQYYIALYAQHATSSRPTLVRTLHGEQDWYRATVTGGLVRLECKEPISGGAVPGPRPIAGDVNSDGVVDGADIDSVISVMAHAGHAAQDDRPAPSQQQLSADVNGDGMVDVADVVAIIAIMTAEK